MDARERVRPLFQRAVRMRRRTNCRSTSGTKQDRPLDDSSVIICDHYRNHPRGGLVKDGRGVLDNADIDALKTWLDTGNRVLVVSGDVFRGNAPSVPNYAESDSRSSLIRDILGRSDPIRLPGQRRPFLCRSRCRSSVERKMLRPSRCTASATAAGSSSGLSIGARADSSATSCRRVPTSGSTSTSTASSPSTGVIDVHDDRPR